MAYILFKYWSVLSYFIICFACGILFCGQLCLSVELNQSSVANGRSTLQQWLHEFSLYIDLYNYTIAKTL